MIDPVTAVATASAAFNIIKKGFEIGRDVEDMSSDLSRWMGAAADIKKAEEYNKNPPLFKKLFAGNAVEAEAMEIFLAKKNGTLESREGKGSKHSRRSKRTRFARKIY